ncbi:MAG TPA: hypothetical protein HA237_04375 [Candidatus Diapherotrites archaeon]|uniref:Uncharacterized protein n=1 Tax=Candidatus Iainarchaeum sp. TaxID=3101447 RepID=A0A7J4ISS9_9ARCH|nr:hypothetical protein [Candidatus Diapherotrites archaeon]
MKNGKIIWEKMMDFALENGFDFFRLIYFDKKELDKTLWKFKEEEKKSNWKWFLGGKDGFWYIEGKLTEESEKALKEMKWNGFGFVRIYVFDKQKTKHIRLNADNYIFFKTPNKKEQSLLNEILKPLGSSKQLSF